MFISGNARKRRGRLALLQVMGVAAAVLLPYLFLSFYLPTAENLALARASLIGSFVATALGAWFMRSISAYPGVEEVASVLPAFSGAYALLLLVFVLGRFEYSRILFVGSYAIVIVWFYVLALTQRGPDFTYGIIGSDLAVENLLTARRGIRWVRLESPSAPVDRLDAVAVDLRSALSDEWERRLSDYALLGLPVLHVKHLAESLSGRVELEHLSENQFGTLTPLSAYMNAKYAIDWLAALVAAIVLIPATLVVAVLIKLDSPGPVLFRQVRVGYRGAPFRVFKFRTMRPVVESPDRALTTAKTISGDDRVTRIGGVLRRTRIDELPQVLNILRGEMSWIGPRPEALVLSQWYEAEIPFYRYRHIVRPGITGWAQVNQGHVVEITDVTSKLHYDFYYIKNFGYWIDALIVARTIKTMLTGFGAK